MSCHSPPVASKLCSAAWAARDAERHRSRLAPGCVAPSVDATPPRLVALNRAKRTHAADQEGRRIDRDNAILMRKMNELVATHTHARGDAASPPLGPRSLNAAARRHAAERIEQENAAILRRITERRPVYERAEWSRHQARHDAYRDNLRERALPTDTAAAAALIPLPRFLRQHHGDSADAAAATQRKPHAYIDGNYSRTFARTSMHTQQPGQAAAAADKGSLSYSSGSQSARMHTESSGRYGGGGRGGSGGGSGVVLHTLYQPPCTPTPHRTGVSKQTTSRTHQLQPIQPASARQAQHTSSPRAMSAAHAHDQQQPPQPEQQQLGVSQAQAQQQQSVLPPPIALISKGFGDGAHTNVSVHEIGSPDAAAASSTSVAADSSNASAASSDANCAASLDPLVVSPIDPSVHSLLFRVSDSAAPVQTATLTGVQVPFRLIGALDEVRRVGEETLRDPAMRAHLAQLITDRLQMDGSGQMRFIVDAHSPVAHAVSQQSSDHVVSTADAHSSAPPLTSASDDPVAVAVAEAEAAGTSDASCGADPAAPWSEASHAVGSPPAVAASDSTSSLAPVPAPSLPPVAYTDSMGTHYYFDAVTQQYQSFPPALSGEPASNAAVVSA